jgi:hypothetical protein
MLNSTGWYLLDSGTSAGMTKAENGLLRQPVIFLLTYAFRAVYDFHRKHMKKVLMLSAVGLALLFLSCAKNYSKDIVGKWDAGKASLNSTITVTIRGDSTMTAEMSNLDMKPVNATYAIVKDKFIIRFPSFVLSYKIIKLDRKVLVMKSKFGRITWNRLE